MSTLDATPIPGTADAAGPAGIDDKARQAAELSAAKRELLERRLRKAASAAGQTAIPRRPEGEAPPLSFAQERLWFMEQFAPGTAAYGDPLLTTFGSDFDEAAFRSALRDLTERHEALRMRFPATADGRPTVVLDPPHEVPLPVHEVCDGLALDREIERLSTRPYDLARGPLLRADLLRVTGESEHYVVVDMHHSVTDGWSDETVLTDLAELYRAHRAAEPPNLPAAPTGYGDFAKWQRDKLGGPEGATHLDYWVRRLQGVPAIELPTDRPRPAVQSFDGASHHFRLDQGLTEQLNELGRAHRATLFMTLLAAYQALLARYCGQTDFAVGTPVAGRSHPDLDRTVGMFVNMLPIRAQADGDPTGAELIGRVRRAVLDALAHEAIPFEKVVNDLGLPRDVQRSAVFQVMFVLQNYEFRSAPRMVGEKTALRWRPVELPATRFDLELHAYAGRDGGLECRFVYNTALFGSETVARIQRHFSALLRDLVARPHTRLGDLELLDEHEIAELTAWNDTGFEHRTGVTLHGLVADQVRRTPDAIAVADENRSLTYRELAREAAGVTGELAGLGVGPESFVAVCADRSVDLVVALLGVLGSGAAYLPLDPEYPSERLAFMLADSGARVALTQPHLADRVSGAETVVMIDACAAAIDGAHAGIQTTEISVPDTAAAYLIYTSGSTGRPKGVVNTHRGIVNRLEWMQHAFGLRPDDVVLQKTPAGFDVSVWEFFWPLIQGARVVLARPGGHRDPAYLRDTIREQGVTTVHFVPSMLDVFLADAGGEGCESVERIMCSGEELPAVLARRCVEAIPWAGLHNLYGPTEAAVDVTAWACLPEALDGIGRTPIGTPVHNTQIHILDEHLREVPGGAAGQLHIGGVQVSRGYHRRPGLTADRFVPDPFSSPGSRLYATGDLARRRPDGAVEYLGRIDGQVKLRGLRIELGEIEAVLREQPGVTAAAVAVKEPSPGDPRIIGYLVGEPPGTAALRTALGARLPDYMVPSSFVVLDALPLSPNGKLDRRALPTPEAAGGPSEAEYTEPRTDLERTIAEIWGQVLKRDRVGIDDDFFVVGGHSLLATQVVAKLRPVTEEHGGRRFGVMDLFQNKTVRSIAAFIGGGQDAGPRGLLYELTAPIPDDERVCTYVCVPYGGGSAAVYQAIADAMPAGHALLSVAIPGHDVGLDEEPLPFEELARRCCAEVLEKVAGPLVLYGHCGVGGALIVELARQVEAAGREVGAVYVGGIFPFAKPRGLLSRFQTWVEDLGSNRAQVNWLKSMGVAMGEIDPEQADRIIGNMRQDGKSAEAHFTALLAADPARLRAPIISVVGERDPITDFYQERYREWQFLADRVAVVVLDEAGHFFLRYRADELADIITRTHKELQTCRPGIPDASPASDRPTWWVEGASLSRETVKPTSEHAKGMRRFLAVASGQLVSAVGSGLTAFAIPVWILQKTGSLGWFGLTGVLAIVPMLILMPAAGAVADRADRRKVLMAAGAAAGGVELGLAALMWTGYNPLWAVYIAMILIICAGTFQRVTFIAAIPQLAPKQFLGHANGIAQTINGAGLLFAPLLAAGLYAAIGLKGILVLDVISYAFALSVLAAVKFPDLMGRRRRETFWTQVLGGARLSWRVPQFRAMLTFFGIGNLLYAAPILLVTPLVLSFAQLAQVGTAAVAEGLGALAGGAILTVWGGPEAGRMRTIMRFIAASGGFVALTGLRPAMPFVLAGVFGTALALGIANGIYFTIIQVKIPQRFHGRVIALNQSIAWATIPLGFALFVPPSGPVLNPLLKPGGALAGTVGQVLGTGEGRGLGLAYVVFGLLMAINALIGLRLPILRDLDRRVPDADPDDLIGKRALDERSAGLSPSDEAVVAAAAVPQYEEEGA